jgi:hypothetical protein
MGSIGNGMSKKDQLDDTEVEKRSDDLLNHMINRAPQPHAIRPQSNPRSQKRVVSDQRGRDQGKSDLDA